MQVACQTLYPQRESLYMWDMSSIIRIIDASPEAGRHLENVLQEAGLDALWSNGNHDQAIENEQLVIIDPGSDHAAAFRLCHHIKKTTPHTKVLLLCDQSLDDHYWVSQAGADALLDKPFNIRRLNDDRYASHR